MIVELFVNLGGGNGTKTKRNEGAPLADYGMWFWPHVALCMLNSCLYCKNVMMNGDIFTWETKNVLNFGFLRHSDKALKTNLSTIVCGPVCLSGVGCHGRQFWVKWTLWCAFVVLVWTLYGRGILLNCLEVDWVQITYLYIF